MRHNEDKLKVIGVLLPSNNIDEDGPLLRVLDMLEDVNILDSPILVVLCMDLAALLGTLLQR